MYERYVFKPFEYTGGILGYDVHDSWYPQGASVAWFRSRADAERWAAERNADSWYLFGPWESLPLRHLGDSKRYRDRVYA